MGQIPCDRIAIWNERNEFNHQDQDACLMEIRISVSRLLYGV